MNLDQMEIAVWRRGYHLEWQESDARVLPAVRCVQISRPIYLTQIPGERPLFLLSSFIQEVLTAHSLSTLLDQHFANRQQHVQHFCGQPLLLEALSRWPVFRTVEGGPSGAPLSHCLSCARACGPGTWRPFLDSVPVEVRYQDAPHLAAVVVEIGYGLAPFNRESHDPGVLCQFLTRGAGKWFAVPDGVTMQTAGYLLRYGSRHEVRLLEYGTRIELGRLALAVSPAGRLSLDSAGWGVLAPRLVSLEKDTETSVSALSLSRRERGKRRTGETVAGCAC
jgi:hypothetical protein